MVVQTMFFSLEISLFIFCGCCPCSGNPKEEPGAIICRVAQSFLRFGTYQIHAFRGKESLDIIRALSDYSICHHFPHIEKMSKSDDISFEVSQEGSSAVDLTSNKYAGNILLHMEFLVGQVLYSTYDVPLNERGIHLEVCNHYSCICHGSNQLGQLRLLSALLPWLPAGKVLASPMVC